MAKTGLLSPLRVGRETKPGRYGDGGGLYLQIKPGGSKSWLFRYKVDGKSRMDGLGAFPEVSLAAARDKAAALRGLRANRLDPREVREADRRRQKLEAAQTLLFRDAAEALIASREAEWKNAKQAQLWRQTLEVYAYPNLGDLPVGQLSTRHILNVLQQVVPPHIATDGRVVRVGGVFWTARPETARRVRARIEEVLDWARVNEYRDGDNPARWAGNLEYALKGGITRRHHPALPYAELPAFLTRLRGEEVVAAAAMEFLIFTVGRTSEVLGARWPEVSDVGDVWVIPGERMKMKKEHRVPLSPPAQAVLAKMRVIRRGEFIFPGVKPDLQTRGEDDRCALLSMSNMALLALLRRMERTDITPHGFRSSFKDWAMEETDFADELSEMALAHDVKSAVKKAYQRGDLFKKRVALMAAWADFCEGGPAANVVPILGAVA